jgi:RNA-directed DNA polymerase
MKKRQEDNDSVRVRESAKHAEEVAYSSCTEPGVWTEGMSAALERGVNGGKWYSLWDKVFAMNTLRQAWKQVAANKGAAGCDGLSVAFFAKDVEAHLRQLHRELVDGSYDVRPVLRVWIDKPGSSEQRPLGIPAVRDRIVQGALLLVIGPIFEAEFCELSFGFRPGRSAKDALRVVEQGLLDGQDWIVDADLKSYFDTIPHERLLAYVSDRISDGHILGLLRQILNAPVVEGDQTTSVSSGTPQGGVISPLLANLYLHALDKEMAEAGFTMVRYADDFVILCRSEAEALDALSRVQVYVDDHELTLHPVKTQVVHVPAQRKSTSSRQRDAASADDDEDDPFTGSFDFLGYSFVDRKRHWPTKKAEQRFRAGLRPFLRRANGRSLPEIICLLNLRLRGWFEYFKHSWRTTFPGLDGWVRMRLRSILRKRRKRRGRGRGADHQRWPNCYFKDLGLICLAESHANLLADLK